MFGRIKSKKTSAPDYVFLSVVVIITVFGLVMLTSASSDLAEERFGNSFYYLNHQILNGLSVGIAGFLVGFFVYYRRWEKLAIPLLVLNIVLLTLIFLPSLGFTTKGATRWLDIGGVSLQPAELLKLTFFIYLAAWLSKSGERSKKFLTGFLPFMILVGVIMALIVFQPSTTTAAIIFASALATYFTAGGRVSFLFAAVLVAALSFSILVYVTPYRLERVTTFFSGGEVDRLDEGYHLDQSLTAIGSGGWFGVGFGQSTTKLRYLPEPIGDSIFAIIAEELGFVGASLLVIAFLFLVLRGLRIAKRTSDNFGRLLVTGFITLLGIQTFINIGAVSGLIPFTGVPLPFVSYGGTALAVFLTMSGIIVNVSKYR